MVNSCSLCILLESCLCGMFLHISARLVSLLMEISVSLEQTYSPGGLPAKCNPLTTSFQPSDHFISRIISPFVNYVCCQAKTRLLSRGELGESTYPEIVLFFFPVLYAVYVHVSFHVWQFIYKVQSQVLKVRHEECNSPASWYFFFQILSKKNKLLIRPVLAAKHATTFSSHLITFSAAQ